MSGGGSRLGRGAHNLTRTDDLFLTKEVLCQLSYVGPRPIASSLVGREGIEPPQPKAAGLQPAELTTCSTYPLWQRHRRGTAVPGVNPPTGSCSLWIRRRDSNPEPAVYKTAALPIELRRQRTPNHGPPQRRGLIGRPARGGQARRNDARGSAYRQLAAGRAPGSR